MATGQTTIIGLNEAASDAIEVIETNTAPLLVPNAGGYVRQDSTATIAKETGGNLATVKTNTDPLVASGAGGYIRQDSTGTIAKETGGNLATLAGKDFATQTTLALIKAKTDNLDVSLSGGSQKTQIVDSVGTSADIEIMQNGDQRLMTDAVLEDRRGRYAEFTQIRDMRVAMPYRLTGALFSGTTVDSTFWTTATSGAGSSATQATGVVTLASGTANSGYSQLQSVRKARFIFAHPLVLRMAFRIPTLAVALNTRRWGVFTTSTVTPTDGFFFSCDASGVLSVNCANGGSVTSVSSGSFNGNATEYTLDTNVHTFEIHYFVMQVQFFVDDHLVHTFTPTTANLSGDYTLPITVSSVNGAAGVTSGTVECWATVVSRMGRETTQPTSFYQAGKVAAQVLKRGAGTLHQLIISGVVNNAVVTLYDNTAASGTVLFSSGSMSNSTQPFDIDLHEVPYFTGLTLAITTSNCNATVVFE